MTTLCITATIFAFATFGSAKSYLNKHLTLSWNNFSLLTETETEPISTNLSAFFMNDVTFEVDSFHPKNILKKEIGEEMTLKNTINEMNLIGEETGASECESILQLKDMSLNNNIEYYDEFLIQRMNEGNLNQIKEKKSSFTVTSYRLIVAFYFILNIIFLMVNKQDFPDFTNMEESFVERF